ncbi:MAG TPA: alpha/beta fold hydrolase [Acidimicrobiia bacterium]|nr:alpha/beta fold hydrolase [Acidimicrobiia bacterium]
MRRSLVSVVAMAALMAGAFALPPTPPAVAGAAPAPAGPTAGRPYGLEVPRGYDGRARIPLVVLLHGYTSNGAAQAAYFRLVAEADKAGFLLAYPDGTRDRLNNRFWNATDACCDFFRTGVDDVAYLDAMIGEIEARYPVDPARVYLVGHSNGAFMAHRYACDRAARVAAIVTLAGMTWKDQGRCPGGSAVSVLHVHGRQDETINYNGGATPEGVYPGAVETAGDWAAQDGCSGALAATGRTFDLDSTVPGAETDEQATAGCPAGVAVDLWTIEGGHHVPAFNDRWADAIWAFMATHPKVG